MMRELLTTCRSATSFEAAARPLLRVVLELAARQTPGAEVLRAMVHLRPGGAYRGLVIEEWPARGALVAPRSSGDGPALESSLTAWHLVERCQSAVEIDVRNARARVPSGDELPLPAVAGGHDLFRSQTRLLRRNTTDVFALPLYGLGRGILGMLSIEAHAEGPRALDWNACASDIQLLADVASPYLDSLPPERRSDPGGDPLLPVVGQAMQPIVRLLSVFAAQDETLMLSGPTGAGKSRLAQWCHARSARSDGPFEVVDMVSVPDDMQMAELFGWRRGAFTGAVDDHHGYVSRAAGGTLFIDEIDKLSLKAQAGLLTFLERREFRMLGDRGGPHTADVRVVVGTNADLPKLVASGAFREDVYYRLNVLPIRVPPLDERRDEIAGWAHFMLQRRAQEARRGQAPRLSAEAATLLATRDWPGNLRQLDNVLRRAFAIALTDDDASAGELAVSERHVRLSLGLEGERESTTLVEALRAAGAAFAAEAQRQAARGRTLDLDFADTLRAFALAAALDHAPSREQVCRLYGKASLVEGRNQHKLFRRELSRLVELLTTLGLPASSDVVRRLETTDAS